MTAGLGAADLARMRRAGIGSISGERGLTLFDASIEAARALTLALPIDRAALRSRAAAGTLPPLFGGLAGIASAKGRRSARREKGWLLSRLAATPASERGKILEEAIRAQVATTIGHASSEKVGPQSSFPELGFDSLASLELRDWLSSATGLNLSASVLFDYPTSEALASHVESQLVAAEYGAPGVGGPEPMAGRSQPEATTPDSIASLYRRAEEVGRLDDGGALLAIAARLRPTFTVDVLQDHLPRPIQLADGDEGPKLICTPSLLAMSGPHQYVKFAQHLEGKRSVAVVPIGGFLDGELLPADLEVAKATQAAAIRECANGEPYVLLGHSTGGHLAHHLVERLDSIGAPPRGLIKVDTYSSAGLGDVTPHVLAGMRERAGSYFDLTDHRLTAMAAYMELVESGEVGDVRLPGLLVRAADPMPGMVDVDNTHVQGEGMQDVRTVPGDHFTMMETHASHVAQVVDEWLVELGRVEAA